MIREATIEDVPAIADMGLDFLATDDYQGVLSENRAQIEATSRFLITDQNGVIFVAETPVGLVGMISMLAFTHHFSGERVAGELVWWVKPAHRGIGIRLLRRAEQWAAESGARRIQMIAPNESVAHIYERLGYTMIETAYQRTV